MAKQVDQTVPDAGVTIRMAIVQDMQTNATQAQGEQVYAAPTTASAFNAVAAYQSLDTLGRFKILKDVYFTMQNPNISWDGTNLEQQGLVRSFAHTVSFKRPVVVNFNATNGGTIADIVDNSFHVLATASNVDLVPTIVYQARVCYKD